jgi:ABC-type transport system substrate-binding protein
MESKMNYRISRRQFLRVSAFTAASLAAAACGQPAAPAAPATEAPAAEVETAAGGIPKGGIIRYKGSGGRTTYFSPLWFYETTAWHNTMKLVWPGLVIHNTTGGMDPYLAESFEVGEDADSVTFHLPAEAQWSDGVPLTANDVKWTYERLLTPGFLDMTAGGWGFLDGNLIEGYAAFADGSADEVSGIVVIDDHTVRFQLVQPDVTFPRLLYRSIAPSHVYEGATSIEEIEAHPFNSNSDVHSGPFRLVEYKETQYIELEAVRPYWLDLPYLHEANVDKIIMFQNLSPEAAIAKVEAGELEILERAGGDILQRASAMEGATLTCNASPSFGGIGVNGRKEYLYDKRVRQAMMHAIDREVLNILRWEGLGQAITSPVNFPDWAANPNINPYEHDPDKARAILEEVGWDFDREIIFQSHAEGEDPIAAYVQQALGDAGINVKIIHVKYSAFIEIMREGNMDLWSESGYDGSHPALVAGHWACGGVYSEWTAYCNEELDELVSMSAATTDPEMAKEVAWQISAIMNDELPYLWVTQDPLCHLVSDRVGNFIWNPSLGDTSFNAADWYLKE